MHKMAINWSNEQYGIHDPKQTNKQTFYPLIVSFCSQNICKKDIYPHELIYNVLIDIKMQSSFTSQLKQGQYKINRQDAKMCLGQGSFGKVFKCYDTKNKIYLALKQIDQNLMEKYGEEMKDIILSQINVMKKFSRKMREIPCRNLVKLYDCFRSDKYIYIVMEICNSGTLFDLLKLKKSFTQPQVVQIAWQMINGLVYLEKMNVCHRDFKPQNIFIQSHNGKFIYKIGDFGFAAQKASFDDVMGTYPYMAPEIYKLQKYTNTIDVWSLGVTLHQLLFNELYFYGQSRFKIQQLVQNKQYKLSSQKEQKISCQLYDFIKLCLNKNKQQRLSASQLITHNIFKDKEQQVELNKGFDQKSTVFQILNYQIQRCRNMVATAGRFQQMSRVLKIRRNTIFVQLYLLKYAYCSMNRMAYTISTKLNYLNMPSQRFQQLINPGNFQQYEQLDKLSKQVWQISTQKFNTKYIQFTQTYLQKFKPQQKQLIAKSINSEPYEDPILQIFKNQLQKWIKVMKSLQKSQRFDDLLLNCRKLLAEFKQM